MPCDNVVFLIRTNNGLLRKWLNTSYFFFYPLHVFKDSCGIVTITNESTTERMRVEEISFCRHKKLHCRMRCMQNCWSVIHTCSFLEYIAHVSHTEITIELLQFVDCSPLKR